MTIALKANADGLSGAIQVGGADAVPFNAGGAVHKMRNLVAAVNANALAITLNPCVLDFRSATLSDGTTTPALIDSPLTITIPSGATLGMVNATQGRLVLLVAYNAGSPVLCVANIAGGVNLDETTLISPTTISAGATSAGVIYSASAVAANSPFRVVGALDITEATAGTWAAAPTLVQGVGGQALATMASLGMGQTWQDMTASRVTGTTYYNTTGRPIFVSVRTGSNQSASIYVSGQNIGYSYAATGYAGQVVALVPPGASYYLNTGSVWAAWFELR